MKANQKFRNEEDAVSPVIAVILMVAITVVLSATVYVWVSGFGSQQSKAARSVTLISDGPIANGLKTFTIAGADSSLRYQDLAFTIDGAAQSIDTACSPAAAKVGICRGGTVLAGTSLVQAGDALTFQATTGQTLRILDQEANSVLYTVTIG